MLQVRDELRMTVIAYQTLYESSIAFGIRKSLRAEQGQQLQRHGRRRTVNYNYRP